MEGLDITKALIIAGAYFVVTSSFFNERRKFMLATYIVFLLIIKLIGAAGGIEFYATIATLIVTCAYIAKGHGWLKGLNFTLTIFAAFQWTIAFLGSASFIFLRYEQIMGTNIFHISLSSSLVVIALVLRVNKRLIFKDASQTLLLIDSTAKLVFVLFFNWFLPRYFVLMGGVAYSVLTLVLLGVAMIFAVYREYSMHLESKIVAANSKLESLLRWADAVIAKHEDLSLVRFPDIVHQIKSPVLQAVMYEFIDTANQRGIEVDITISSPINAINLDSYELFDIVSSFVKDSFEEAKEMKFISVMVGGDEGFSFMIRTATEPSKTLENIEYRKSTIIGYLQRNRHHNITISISKSECFIQSLYVL